MRIARRETNSYQIDTHIARLGQSSCWSLAGGQPFATASVDASMPPSQVRPGGYPST